MSKVITPIGSLVLIKLIEVDDEKSGDLFMPSSSDALKRGIVVAIGDDSDKKIPDILTIGSTVVIYSSLRNELTVNGEKHYMLPIQEILAIESLYEFNNKSLDNRKRS